MDACDMLDVVHFFFESDLLSESAEFAEAKSKMRSSLYREMYETTYKYPVGDTGKSYNYSTASGEESVFSAGNAESTVAPFDPDKPDKGPTKPFVPATEFDPDTPNPFGGVLDPPSGF